MRIGLIGCGAWGRNILRDLVDIGVDVEVVGRSDSTRSAALDGGAIRTWERLEDLAGVAGVVIATPSSTHATMSMRALELGVPVFCEKPIATDVASARELAVGGRDRLFVMHKWRYHRGVEEIGRLARTEEFGELEGLRVTFGTWGRAWPDVDAAWTLLPHMLSIVLEVTGRVPPVESCVGALMPTGDLEAIVRLGHGPIVMLDVSTVTPGYVRRVSARFRDTVVTLADGYDTHLTVWSPDREDGTIEFGAAMPLRDELAAFVSFLDGGPPPRSSAGEGAVVVEAVEEILGSLQP